MMRHHIAVFAIVFTVVGSARADSAKVGPWDLSKLKQVPSMRWVDPTGPVQSLLYAGEDDRGRTTEVFAFYASPRTLGKPVAADAKFPGVVLVHGGGGTAFAEWAWLWAQRGYAAIAMDLAGCRPKDPVYDAKTGAPVPNQTADRQSRTRLADGGPDQGPAEKFDSIGGDPGDDWPFHAAAAVIRAHSLLRSMKEVDADHTAVTGISWGGYTACLVASFDDRFKAAVPVYGCGFLFEGESVQKPLPRTDPLRQRGRRLEGSYWSIHCCRCSPSLSIDGFRSPSAPSPPGDRGACSPDPHLLGAGHAGKALLIRLDAGKRDSRRERGQKLVGAGEPASILKAQIRD